MKSKYKIVICDDHKMFVEAITDKLKKHNNFEVVGMFLKGRETLEYVLLNKQNIDVVLLDISLKDENGVNVLKKIKIINSSIKVIVVSSHDELYYLNKLLDSGVDAYVTKSNGFEEIIDAISSVYAKGFYLSPNLKELLVQDSVQRKRNKISSELSEREIQIIQLICEELKSSEIAEKLFINVKTVEGHRHRIMEKIGVQSSVGVVKFAIRNGLFYQD